MHKLIRPQPYGTLSPPKTTEHPATPLTKNAQRREKFRLLGAAITADQARQAAWRDHLGDHAYVFKGEPIQDFAVTSKLGNGTTRGTRGPAMKAMHWIRGIRRDSKRSR